MIERLENILIHCVDGEENIKAIKNAFALFKNEGGISIEVEDYDGNTIGGVKLNALLLNHRTSDSGELSVADFDEDYLFNTYGDLIRIQLDGTLKSTYEIHQEEWESVINTGICGRTSLFENEQDLVLVEEYETEPYTVDIDEVLHMLINDSFEYDICTDNCIRLANNKEPRLYLICPLCATEETQNSFKKIKGLLG